MPVTWTRANIGTATPDQKKEMDWVYATLFFTNEDAVTAYKRERTASYNELFERYAWAMDNRPGTAGIPPTPAYAMIVTGDVTTWSELALSPTERVCDTKVYQPAPKPTLGTGKIGTRIGRTKFFVCLQGDTTLGDESMYLASADTPPVIGIFTKIASPIQASGAGTGNVQVLGVWEFQQ